MPRFQDKDTITTNTLSNKDAYFPMVQNNLNKKATLTQIKRDAVAVCNTASATGAKTATIRNMPDFELISGITVTVYFAETNGASSPTLNVNNTGSWPLRLENQASTVTIGSGCWVAGAILECKYVEVSDTDKYWLIVGHDTAQVTSDYTILADGTSIYTKTKNIENLSSSITSDFQISEVQVYRNVNVVTFYAVILVGSANVNDNLLKGLPISTVRYMDFPMFEHSPDTYKGFVRLMAKDDNTSVIIVQGSSLPYGQYRISGTYICEN